jgi:hypothetical protein
MGWNVAQHAKDRAVGRRFTIQAVRTNGSEGVVIVDRASRRPVWSDFLLPDKQAQATNEMVSFWFDGRDVMDINLGPGRPPRRGVMFYDTDGKMKTMWADRGGNGTFDERVFYGDQAREEVWFNDSWHTVIRRDGKRGAILNGKWCEIGRVSGVWSLLQPRSP